MSEQEFRECFGGTSVAGVAMELDELRRRVKVAERRSAELTKACERFISTGQAPQYLRNAIQWALRS